MSINHNKIIDIQVDFSLKYLLQFWKSKEKLYRPNIIPYSQTTVKIIGNILLFSKKTYNQKQTKRKYLLILK